MGWPRQLIPPLPRRLNAKHHAFVDGFLDTAQDSKSRRPTCRRHPRCIRLEKLLNRDALLRGSKKDQPVAGSLDERNRDSCTFATDCLAKGENDKKHGFGKSENSLELFKAFRVRECR